MQSSEEMQRRTQNWTETLTGSHDQLINGKGTWKDYQHWMAEMASKPVALSDMASTLPLWLAKYEMEMQEHGVKGDAIYAADKAVRRAHGSTADLSAARGYAPTCSALAHWLYDFHE